MTSPNLIQETNIENILETHLPAEIAALDARVEDLNSLIADLNARRQKLQKIADAAGLFTTTLTREDA